MEIRLQNVRIAFPAIDKPEAFGDGEPAFQGKFIILPKSKNSQAIKEAMLAVAKEQWKEKAAAVTQMLKDDKKVCYIEAPYRSKKTGEVYSGFEGMHSLSTRSKTQPTVFTKSGLAVTDPREMKSLIYSGCFVHAKVQLWAQDNKWGRRINCSLLGVMFAVDGEAFGGATPASAADFADLASEEDPLDSDNDALV